MTKDEALHRAAAYCSQSEHCRSEVREKLQKWEIGPDDQESIIGYLEQENYLNQQRYALAYARDKFRYNKWGKVRIRMELQRKGIPADELQEALEQIEEESYLEQAVGLARVKLRNLKYSDDFERDGKLFRFLAGRGFETDCIRKAIKEAIAFNQADSQNFEA